MLFYNPTTKSEPNTGSFKLISGVKTLKGDRNVPTPFLDRQNTRFQTSSAFGYWDEAISGFSRYSPLLE